MNDKPTASVSPSRLVSFGLVDNAPAIRGSPRQQLDDLNDQKPGRERIKKRLSLLSAEREASRLWKESLAAGRPEQGQQSSEYENVLRIHVEESGIKEQEDVDSYSGGPASGDSIGAAREGPQRSEERGTRSEKEKALEALRRAGALEKLHIDIDGNWSGGAAPSEATDVVAALVAEQRKRRQIEACLEQAAAEQDDLAVEVSRLNTKVDDTEAMLVAAADEADATIQDLQEQVSKLRSHLETSVVAAATAEEQSQTSEAALEALTAELSETQTLLGETQKELRHELECREQAEQRRQWAELREIDLSQTIETEQWSTKMQAEKHKLEMSNTLQILETARAELQGWKGRLDVSEHANHGLRLEVAKAEAKTLDAKHEAQRQEAAHSQTQQEIEGRDDAYRELERNLERLQATSHASREARSVEIEAFQKAALEAQEALRKAQDGLSEAKHNLTMSELETRNVGARLEASVQEAEAASRRGAEAKQQQKKLGIELEASHDKLEEARREVQMHQATQVRTEQRLVSEQEEVRQLQEALLRAEEAAVHEMEAGSRRDSETKRHHSRLAAALEISDSTLEETRREVQMHKSVQAQTEQRLTSEQQQTKKLDEALSRATVASEEATHERAAEASQLHKRAMEAEQGLKVSQEALEDARRSLAGTKESLTLVTSAEKEATQKRQQEGAAAASQVASLTRQQVVLEQQVRLLNEQLAAVDESRLKTRHRADAVDHKLTTLRKELALKELEIQRGQEALAAQEGSMQTLIQVAEEREAMIARRRREEVASRHVVEEEVLQVKQTSGVWMVKQHLMHMLQGSLSVRIHAWCRRAQEERHAETRERAATHVSEAERRMQELYAQFKVNAETQARSAGLTQWRFVVGRLMSLEQAAALTFWRQGMSSSSPAAAAAGRDINRILEAPVSPVSPRSPVAAGRPRALTLTEDEQEDYWGTALDLTTVGHVKTGLSDRESSALLDGGRARALTMTEDEQEDYWGTAISTKRVAPVAADDKLNNEESSLELHQALKEARKSRIEANKESRRLKDDLDNAVQALSEQDL